VIDYAAIQELTVATLKRAIATQGLPYEERALDVLVDARFGSICRSAESLQRATTERAGAVHRLAEGHKQRQVRTRTRGQGDVAVHQSEPSRHDGVDVVPERQHLGAVQGRSDMGLAVGQQRRG